MKLIFTNVFLCFAIMAIAHPLHLSITNITIADSEIDVQVKTFSKDIIIELNALHHNNYDITFYTEYSAVDSLLVKYINDNFLLTFDGVRIEFDSLQVKIEGDEFIFNLKASYNKVFENCKMSNTILMQVFHDQKNLMIIDYNGVEEGVELNIDKPVAEISFKNN